MTVWQSAAPERDELAIPVVQAPVPSSGAIASTSPPVIQAAAVRPTIKASNPAAVAQPGAALSAPEPQSMELLNSCPLQGPRSSDKMCGLWVSSALVIGNRHVGAMGSGLSCVYPTSHDEHNAFVHAGLFAGVVMGGTDQFAGALPVVCPLVQHYAWDDEHGWKVRMAHDCFDKNGCPKMCTELSSQQIFFESRASGTGKTDALIFTTCCDAGCCHARGCRCGPCLCPKVMSLNILPAGAWIR